MEERNMADFYQNMQQTLLKFISRCTYV